MKSRGGSLLGEEMGLGNLSRRCSVQCLSIRDGCWMVTRGLEVSAAEEELGWEVLRSSCAAESLCVWGGRQRRSMGSSKRSGRGRTG